MKKIKNKAQITIFVIIAIIIVAVIALFFLFRSGLIPGIGGTEEKNPRIAFQDCLEDKILETTDLISKQGGYINPILYRELDGEKISYLCYNQNYYLSCINQEPMLIQHIKEEIKNNIDAKVRNCFDQFKTSLEKTGYNVDANYRDFSVQLVPEKVIVDIDAEITTTRNEQTSSQKDFVIIFPSRIYELAVVVQEITSQEARFCNFEQLGYMLLYPQFNIDKFRTGEGDTIYTIEDRKTKEKFKFAVRSCVIPPGF
ncbi:MAG: hypothetical protein WC584_01970 [Candidatus Pacearchaeota archaeon]